MERMKEGTPDGVIRWKKVGGGGFLFNNRIIKPGQTFMAHPNDIPKQFRDTIIPLDEIKEETPVELLVSKKSLYTVKARGKSKTWFDVVDEQGKVLNEKALTKEVAEQLASEL